MALLGHTARLLVSTQDLSASTNAWHALGFTVQHETDSLARLTDGQILVTLVAEPFESPALAYFHSDVSRLQSQLVDKGLTVSPAEPDGISAQLFEGMQAYIHQRPAEQEERHSGEKNDLLGYLDALSIGVADVGAQRRLAEDLGFFVQEEWAGGFPRSDVTDGLVTIAFHQRPTKPYLAYAVELTTSVLADLQELDGVVAEPTMINNEISYVRLTTPEGTRFVIFHDNNYE